MRPSANRVLRDLRKPLPVKPFVTSVTRATGKMLLGSPAASSVMQVCVSSWFESGMSLLKAFRHGVTFFLKFLDKILVSHFFCVSVQENSPTSLAFRSAWIVIEVSCKATMANRRATDATSASFPTSRLLSSAPCAPVVSSLT
jgi:hypothetical protein